MLLLRSLLPVIWLVASLATLLGSVVGVVGPLVTDFLDWVAKKVAVGRLVSPHINSFPEQVITLWGIISRLDTSFVSTGYVGELVSSKIVEFETGWFLLLWTKIGGI